MKQLLTILLLTASSLAWSQENKITLSGGYAFANIEDFDENSTGWRINGLYEFNPYEDNWSHGISVGYIQTQATFQVLLGEQELKANHWPIYYVPKYTFGKEESFRPFIKGALGMHFSDYDFALPLGGTIDTGDNGFYGGLGAGLYKSFGGKIFVNVEYEWAYLGNTYYVDGFMNSAMAGIGIKF